MIWSRCQHKYSFPMTLEDLGIMNAARLVSRGLADLAVLAYFRFTPKTSFHNPFITPVVAPKAVTPAKRR